MASVDIKEIRDCTSLHFYSCLPGMTLFNWAKHAIKMQCIAEFRMVFITIGGKRWFHINIVFFNSKKLPLLKELYSRLFPKFFTDAYLHQEYVDPKADAIEAAIRIRRSGSAAEGKPMNSSETAEYVTFLNYISLMFDVNAKCAADFKQLVKNVDDITKADTDISQKTMLDLSRKHHIRGGSWIISTRWNRWDKIECKMAEVPLRDRVESSLRALEACLKEVFVGSLSDIKYIWRVQWNSYRNSPTLKISNRKSIYYETLFSYEVPSHLDGDEKYKWIYERDEQVKFLYTALLSLRIPNITYKYKPDVITACGFKMTKEISDATGVRCPYSSFMLKGERIPPPRVPFNPARLPNQ